MTARVLIVDDEPVVRMTLKMMLDGFTVTEAESAEAALALTGEYDVCVLDKNLPGISGVDLTKHLRQRDPHAAILLITGYATVDSAVEAMSAGADGFLEKPFDDVASVLNRINEMIEVTRRRRGEPASAGSTRKHLLLAGGPDCAVVMHSAAALPAIALTTVRDGLLARLDAASQKPDLVLADEAMAPAGEFFAFLQQVMQRVPAVVAIMSRPSVEDADQCMRLGIKGLFAKPLQRSVVEERLKELIGQLR